VNREHLHPTRRETPFHFFLLVAAKAALCSAPA
jgi:hypothetical protein